MSPQDVLRQCALFRGFTDTGLGIFGGVSVERTFPAGVPLFAENMVSDSLFVIASGEVTLSARGPGGEEVNLGRLGPGDFMGELSLLKQGQRMCTATASSEVSALEIRNADFQRLLGQKPQACAKLLMAIGSLFGEKVAENREALRGLLARK